MEAPNELREGALRLVAETMAEDLGPSLNAAVPRIGPRVGIASPHRLSTWATPIRDHDGNRPPGADPAWKPNDAVLST